MPRRLPVLGATAAARTDLSAFHRALMAIGLGQYNLVRLSSVIPPGTDVGAGRPGPTAGAAHRTGDRPADFVDGVRGDRLYCVYAEHRTDVPGEEAWAGVGWVRRADGDGGYFVEHDGTSSESVTLAIETSLADMVADEDDEFEPAEWVLKGARCETGAVSALVVVPYAAVPW